ncbi:hypothetical protein QTG56_22780 (plasmid) [Rossellomorea sp. AcN35-11]|nr:hypothetical protein [Rossellomorea aquimaris]WJV32196.1 hypothetical protein QTG56_22780 [Rossellomorea sp. AcN35-11]
MDKFYYWLWGSGIYYILYLVVVLVGIHTAKNIIESPLKLKVTEWQHRYRLRKIRSEKVISKTDRTRGPFTQHIYLLVKSTNKKKSDADTFAFYFVSTSLGSFFGVVSFLNFKDLVFSAIIGGLMAIVPYVSLQVRLRKLRHLMGAEFLPMLQGLAQNYNANSFDIYHSLVDTQKTVRSKELRKILLRLISDLQVSRNEQEIRDTINIFVYTSGTSWAKRLGSIIMKAYLDDENVLSALLVLEKQIEDTEQMLEEEKSHSLDHVWNGFLTVPIFIGSLALGYFSSGTQSWFDLQFGNQGTLVLFVVSVLGVVFSVLISMLIFRPKNDI